LIKTLIESHTIREEYTYMHKTIHKRINMLTNSYIKKLYAFIIFVGNLSFDRVCGLGQVKFSNGKVIRWYW